MSLDQELSSLLGEARKSSVVASNMDKVMKVIKKEQKSKNYKLIRCIFFPEFSKGARFPGSFSVESGVYSLRTEYTIRTNPMTRSFGLAVDPHARGVTNHPIHFFADATMEDWETSRKLDPYSSNEVNPLFPPEVFFAKSRLISCAVTVESISQESSGRFKGGIEYDVNEEFIRPVVNYGNIYRKMLSLALKDTAVHYAAFHIASLIRRDRIPVDSDSMGARLTQYMAAFYPNIPNDAYMFFTQSSNTLATVYNTNDPAFNDTEGLNDTNIMDRVMKSWRKKFREPATDNRWLLAGIAHIFTHSMGEITLGGMIFPYYANVTYEFVEFKARLAAQLYNQHSYRLNADQFKGGALNYQRLQMLAYRNETAFDEGIRVVYIPKSLHTLSYDSAPRDIILIGGMQLPAECALKISVVRHFEGIPYKGMTSLYPVMEQPEDEETVKVIEALAKKNPDLLRILPKDLPEMYKAMKSRFKWLDTAIKETPSGYDISRDFLNAPSMEMD